MKKMNIIIGFVVFGLMMSCASQKKVEQDDDFATDATSTDSKSTADTALDSNTAPSTGTDESEFALNEPDSNSKKSSPEDEFADFDKKDKATSGAEASQSASENLSLDEPKGDSAAAQASNGTPGSNDQFAEFDKAAGSSSAATATHDPELSLEKELNSAEVTPESATPAPEKQAQSADPLQDVALNAPPPPPEVAVNPVIPESAAPLTTDAVVPPPEANASSASSLTSDVPVAASAEAASHESQNLAEIDSVQYKPNQSGGALSINANHPLQFSTRVNSATNQVIVEVQNAVIPNKLKRSLNTKDMASSIGSIDIYQKPNSKVARFVVQLRPGSPDPLVQPEGNSLLIIGASAPGSIQQPSMAHQEGGAPHHSSSGEVAQQSMGGQQPVNGMNSAPVEMNESVQPQSHVGNGQEAGSSSQASVSAGDPIAATGGVLSSDSLEDFLINNNKFYGKKISIETNNLDVKEAIKFIAEESGANLLMDDGLEGKVSLRLRQVPWDQALVLILKAKKLGYVRQGNVLRIARLTDIQNEEAEAIKLLENRRSNEPLMVKRFLISYADIKELEAKIKEFIASTAAVVPGAAGPVVGTAMPGGAPGASGAATSATLPPPAPRGKVISDIRTSSLIVTDTPDNIAKIEKLIAALDSQPRQVLIEGKVIEATEEFSRSIGVNWSSNPVKATTFNKAGLSITQALPTGGALDSSFTWGRVDVLGDLTARLMLGERQDKVRTLSSPKITVLSNQPANISQAVSVQIKAGSTTVANSAGSVTTDQINTVPLGVFLKVTPQASNEGTVTLDMDIEKSTLVAVDSTSTNKRNAKSKVIVKSGQTAVIGGIFEATNTTGVSGVPGLKDIPILGSLFRGQVEQNQKSELIIFVTPHILQPVVGDDKKSSSVLD